MPEATYTLAELIEALELDLKADVDATTNIVGVYVDEDGSVVLETTDGGQGR